MDKFGTLGEMISYARKTRKVKSRIHHKTKPKSKSKTKIKGKRHQRIVLRPMKISSPTARKSILKSIKEVYV